MEFSIKRDFFTLKDRYNELKTRENPTELERMFLHETGNLMLLQSLRNAKKENIITQEDLNKSYQEILPTVPKIKKLVPLTEIEDFSKQYLMQSNSNIKEILKEEQSIASQSYSTDIKIYGEFPESMPVNEAALYAFISTNIGAR
jgi:hypothetical protein